LKQNLSEWGSFYWVVPVVVIALLIVFLLDTQRYRKIKKPALITMLILWTAGLIYLMFLYRLPPRRGTYTFDLFHMYRSAARYKGTIVTNQSLRQILFNILLYVPAGAAFASLTGKPWLAVIIGLLISISTEALQYWSRLGWADIDDVVSNLLGLLLGVLVYVMLIRLKRKTCG